MHSRGFAIGGIGAIGAIGTVMASGSTAIAITVAIRAICIAIGAIDRTEYALDLADIWHDLVDPLRFDGAHRAHIPLPRDNQLGEQNKLVAWLARQNARRMNFGPLSAAERHIMILTLQFGNVDSQTGQ